MGWLDKRVAFRGGPGESRAQSLREAMQATSEQLRALAEDFFRRVPMDKERWLAFNRFREAIFFELAGGNRRAIHAARRSRFRPPQVSL